MEDNGQDDSESSIDKNSRGDEQVTLTVDSMADDEDTCKKPVLNSSDKTANTNNGKSNASDNHAIPNKISDVSNDSNATKLDGDPKIVILDSGDIKYDSIAETIDSVIISDVSELTCMTELSTNEDLSCNVDTVTGLQATQCPTRIHQEHSRTVNTLRPESLGANCLNNENLVNTHVVLNPEHKDSENLNSVTFSSADMVGKNMPHNNNSSQSKTHEERVQNFDRQTKQNSGDPCPVTDHNLNVSNTVNGNNPSGSQTNGCPNLGSSRTRSINGTMRSVSSNSSSLPTRSITSENPTRIEKLRQWLFIKFWVIRDRNVNLLQWLVGPSPGRRQWEKPLDSNMSLAAYAVGISNMLLFPYLMIKHGGVAFLTSYIITLLVIGFPLYLVDISLAQYLSLGPTDVYSILAPMFSGLGWAMIATALFVSMYYSVVLSWILGYLYQSFTEKVQWANCSITQPECIQPSQNSKICAAKEFFHVDVLQQTQEEKDIESNHLSSQIVACLGFSWLVVVLSLIRRGNANCFINTIPYGVLVWLLASNCHEKGIEDCIASFKSLFSPDEENQSTLLSFDVWIDAASQMLFSLGIALGGHGTLASYNKIHQNTLWSSFFIIMWDTLTSILCTCVVYISVYQVTVKCQPPGDFGEAALVAYSVSIMMRFDKWSVFFFLLLFILGISSLIGFVETITTALFHKFSYLQSRYFPFILLTCVLLFLVGLPMCSPKGIRLVELMHIYNIKFSILVLGLLQVILVSHIFGFQKLMKLISKDLNVSIPKCLEWYLAISLKFFVPLAFMVLLTAAAVSEDQQTYSSIGWIFPIISCLFVPVFAVYKIYKNRGTNWQELLSPTSQFRPAHERQQDCHSFVLAEGSEYSLSSSVHAAGGINPYITISSIAEMFRWHHRTWSVENGTSGDRGVAQDSVSLQQNRVLESTL